MDLPHSDGPMGSKLGVRSYQVHSFHFRSIPSHPQDEMLVTHEDLCVATPDSACIIHAEAMQKKATTMEQSWRVFGGP